MGLTDWVTRKLTPPPSPRLGGPGPVVWNPPALSAAATGARGSTSLTGALSVPPVSESGPSLALRPPFPTVWEEQAWAYYRHCGEARRAVEWLASMVSRCHLFIAQVPDSPTSDPTPVDDPGVAGDILTELHDGPIGQAAMLDRIATHLLVPGCTWLAGYPDPSADAAAARTKWSVLSRKEWQHAEATVRLRLPDHPKMISDGWVSLPADQVALVAIYNPDAENGTVATSAFEAAQGTLAELAGLSKRVNADIQSRLAGAGMLPIPESATIPQPAGAENLNLHSDPLISALIAAAKTAIADPDDASAVIPIIIRVADETIANLRHITFSTPFDSQIPILRQDSRRTLAADLDIPASVVLGMEDLNHWAVWGVQDEAVRAHVGPLISQICVAITIKILWPALAATGVADPRSLCVWWSGTEITQRPDRSVTVIAAVTAKPPLISAAAARRELGFEEEDAPTPEELAAAAAASAPPPAFGDQGGQSEPGATPNPPDNPGGVPDSTSGDTQVPAA